MSHVYHTVSEKMQKQRLLCLLGTAMGILWPKLYSPSTPLGAYPAANVVNVVKPNNPLYYRSKKPIDNNIRQPDIRPIKVKFRNNCFPKSAAKARRLCM